MPQSLQMVESTIGLSWIVRITSLIRISVVEITGITMKSLEITCHE